MDSVTPHIYTVDNNTKRNLFIYVFNNITERKNVVESYGPYSNYFTSNNYSIFGIYETWNVLILDTLKGPLNGVINNKNSKIEQIVFKDLNHGNVRTYKGETDHWKGTLTLKYYTHFYKDENGIEQINNYGSGEVFVHYKIPTSIKNVKYNYELIVGPISESSEGDGLTWDQSGNFVIGTDDIFLSKEDVPTITLTWNKEKETIQLKAKK